MIRRVVRSQVFRDYVDGYREAICASATTPTRAPSSSSPIEHQRSRVAEGIRGRSPNAQRSIR